MIDQHYIPLSFEDPMEVEIKCQTSSSRPHCTSTTTTLTTSTRDRLCVACLQPICDRYMMRVADEYYHENTCLKCTSCSIPLKHSCFTRNGKLYCRIDYERLYSKNYCISCGKYIGADELVMRTSENVFHLNCFSCVVCGIQLQKGEQYVVKQSQLFCRSDYIKEVEMLQGYHEDYYVEDVYSSKVDGRRGPKRPRTILNTQQRRAFKASFDISPKPCRKVRENLAKETGLSLRIVQVWFQNQRAKVKKIQKKSRLDTKSTTSETESLGESSLENETKIKIDNESLAMDVSADSESFMNADHEQKFIPKTELDSSEECFKKAFNFCSNLHSFKDDCVEDLQINSIMGLTYSAFQQLMGPLSAPQILNPIDRLYSMQNSYFRGDDGKYHANNELEN